MHYVWGVKDNNVKYNFSQSTGELKKLSGMVKKLR